MELKYSAKSKKIKDSLKIKNANSNIINTNDWSFVLSFLQKRTL